MIRHQFIDNYKKTLDYVLLLKRLCFLKTIDNQIQVFVKLNQVLHLKISITNNYNIFNARFNNQANTFLHLI